MEKQYFKLTKVFDYQQMPKDIKKLIAKIAEERCLCNDSFIEWYFGDSDELIDKWLLDNGVKCNDNVLIKYWW